MKGSEGFAEKLFYICSISETCLSSNLCQGCCLTFVIMLDYYTWENVFLY